MSKARLQNSAVTDGDGVGKTPFAREAFQALHDPLSGLLLAHQPANPVAAVPVAQPPQAGLDTWGPYVCRLLRDPLEALFDGSERMPSVFFTGMIYAMVAVRNVACAWTLSAVSYLVGPGCGDRKVTKAR